MQKRVIGYLYSGRKLGKEELMFQKLAKKKDVELIMINIFRNIKASYIKEKIKKCDIIFNSTAEDFAIEVVKMIEKMGKEVIDSSIAYYYTEDKWMFFLACDNNNIPTPNTILLSKNINIAKKELKEFNCWPVVLKRVIGTMGEYVDRAENLDEAVTIIEKFWRKGNEKLPIIAQEFIDSPSYRVTVIGDKIVQTAIKNSKGWKATGVYAKKFKKFRISPELEKQIRKVLKISKIHICGVDLLKKDKKWLFLEVNSQPGFDFFEKERIKLVHETLNFLIHYIDKKKRKKQDSFLDYMKKEMKSFKENIFSLTPYRV